MKQSNRQKAFSLTTLPGISWLGISLFGISLFGGLACTQPRLVPPNELASGARVLTVSERSSLGGLFVDESFKIGDYDVADVDRDWNHHSGYSVFGSGSNVNTTGFSYRLIGKKRYAAVCSSVENESHTNAVIFTVRTAKSRMACTCRAGEEFPEEEDKQHLLEVFGNFDEQLESGFIYWEGKSYPVSAILETEPKVYQTKTPGFRIDNEEGKVLAAVEAIYPGQIWLSSEIPEAIVEPVTCLLSGLMLYAPSDDRHNDK